MTTPLFLCSLYTAGAAATIAWFALDARPECRRTSPGDLLALLFIGAVWPVIAGFLLLITTLILLACTLEGAARVANRIINYDPPATPAFCLTALAIMAGVAYAAWWLIGLAFHVGGGQ